MFIGDSISYYVKWCDVGETYAYGKYNIAVAESEQSIYEKKVYNRNFYHSVGDLSCTCYVQKRAGLSTT